MNRIKHLWNQFKNWYKKASTRKKIFFWIASVVGLLIIFSIIKGNPPKVEVETVRQQDLARTVLASGTVVSSTDLSLSFQAADVVRSIRVSVGDKVTEGQILATLDSRDESASYTKARGQLLGAEASYRKVLEGASSEEVAVAEVELANAKRTQDKLVENARRKLFSNDLIAKADSSDIDSEAPVISGTYNGTEEGEYRISFYRSTGEIKFTGLEQGVATVSKFPQPFGTKGLLITFPGNGYGYGDEWTVEIPNRDSENYTANLNAYQAALADRDEAITNAEARLNLEKATARTVDVDAALAEVLTARGAVEAAQAEIEKTIIRAPAAGTITRVDLRLGELIETNESVITLQDIGNLYLEADINESNITNIAIGQPVSVTYDALGKGVTYNAQVSSVDLGATVVDGIVNYKIKALVTDITQIKPGMTANLSIQTAFVPNVLVIPTRVITEENGEKSVQIITDERRMKTEKRVITTGLRGDGGLTEVTSGLTAGEKIAFIPQ